MTGDAEARRTVKVLIAEDAIIFAEDLSTTLQDLGYRIAGIAPTRREAVRLAKKIRQSLVLMNVKLAGDMDGVRASEETRTSFDVPVIFLTAYEGSESLCRAMRTELYSYLIKPLADQRVVSVIETAL
jgi:two-component system, response regulator PdtaR